MNIGVDLANWYTLYGNWLLGKQDECYERDRSALRSGQPLEDFYNPGIYRLANDLVHGRPLVVDDNFDQFLMETGRAEDWRNFQELNGIIERIQPDAKQV